MVVSGARHPSAEKVCSSYLTKARNTSDVNSYDNVLEYWAQLPYLEGATSGSTFGEEGLTQSSMSENNASSDALEALSTHSACSFSPYSHENASVFEEISEALRVTPPEVHPFLNMDEQRSLVENERIQRHYEYFLSIGHKNTLPQNELSISSKSLLNEAHRMHVSRLRSYNKTCHEKALPMKDEDAINRQWRCIESAVERDLYMEGFAFVQRRLSCMCIFNPETDERPYWDNEHAREKRLLRQEKVLESILEQAQTGGNPFFLEDS